MTDTTYVDILIGLEDYRKAADKIIELCEMIKSKADAIGMSGIKIEVNPIRQHPFINCHLTITFTGRFERCGGPANNQATTAFIETFELMIRNSRKVEFEDHGAWTQITRDTTETLADRLVEALWESFVFYRAIHAAISSFNRDMAPPMTEED